MFSASKIRDAWLCWSGVMVDLWFSNERLMWWHRRRVARIRIRTSSPVATHGLFALCLRHPRLAGKTKNLLPRGFSQTVASEWLPGNRSAIAAARSHQRESRCGGRSGGNQAEAGRGRLESRVHPTGNRTRVDHTLDSDSRLSSSAVLRSSISARTFDVRPPARLKGC
jgi:hypothetical protein